MKTDALVRPKLLPLVILVGACCALGLGGIARAGNGSDRGGGGGVYDSGQLGWHSLSNVPSTVTKKSYQEEMAAFKKFHSSTSMFVPCKNHPELQAPGAIPGIDKFFEFRVENPRSFLESVVGASRKVTPFASSRLCRSPELIQSYGRFRMVMAEAASDTFTIELLRKTFDAGGSIPIVITDHDFQLDTKSGYQPIDFAVYDPTDRQIFWHSLPEQIKQSSDAIASFSFSAMQRQPLAFLRHEATHLLLHRTMRDQYPAQGEIHYGRRPKTEDCRACAGKQYCQCEISGDEASGYLQWVTSPEAALIEGICDWTELQRDGLDHPYDVPGMVFRAHNRPDGKVCFDSFGKADFSTLTSNEAHINTALRALVMDYTKEGGSITRADVNQSKQISLLNSIVRTSATSINDIAQAYDHDRTTQDALRWERQYFAKDYLVGTELRKQMFATQSGTFFDYCMSAESAAIWFPGSLE
ncbi:hypothetical protein WDW37_16405 [Bdellovibrionota bacterium FG-1]